MGVNTVSSRGSDSRVFKRCSLSEDIPHSHLGYCTLEFPCPSIDSGKTSKSRQIVVLTELSDSGTIGAYEYLAGVRPICEIVSMDVVMTQTSSVRC
jgi:hypothetical protein